MELNWIYFYLEVVLCNLFNLCKCKQVIGVKDSWLVDW